MKNSSIKINATLNIIYTISNILFPLITFPYVSRILQVDLLGKVNFYTNIANYATMLASLGLTTYGIRAVAKVRDNKKVLSKTVVELLLINIVTTIILVLALIVSIAYIPQFKENIILLLLNCILILSSPFSLNWLFSGLEQYSYITRRALIFKTISLLSVFIFVQDKNDYIIYALILILSTVLSYICNFIYSKKFIVYSNYNLECKKHLIPMLTLFASILAINVYTHLDIIMLGFIKGEKDVGLYTTAVYVKAALLTFVNAISAVLLPRISFYVAEGKFAKIKNVLNRSISIIMMITVPLTVFFIFEAADTIMIIGGTNYLDAVPCMIIIMPILLISGFSNITGNQVLIPYGLDYYFMKAVITGAVVDLVLNVVLMPRLGCVGAAIATLSAELVQMSIQLFFSWKYISNSFNYKSIFCYILAVVLSSFILDIVRGLTLNLRFDIVRLIILFSAFFGVYIISLFLLKEKEFYSLICDIKKHISLK